MGRKQQGSIDVFLHGLHQLCFLKAVDSLFDPFQLGQPTVLKHGGLTVGGCGPVTMGTQADFDKEQTCLGRLTCHLHHQGLEPT